MGLPRSIPSIIGALVLYGTTAGAVAPAPKAPPPEAAAPKSAAPPSQVSHPGAGAQASRHPEQDIPRYAKQLAPDAYLADTETAILAKVDRALTSIGREDFAQNQIPASILPALTAVKMYGAKVLWTDVGKINNLDKSVALDDLEAFVDFALAHYDMTARGDYLKLSLDERSRLALKILVEARQGKKFRARDERDTVLNEYGQVEAVRRGKLVAALSDPKVDPKAFSEAIAEMDKFAKLVQLGIPKPKTSPKPVADAEKK